MLIYCVCQAGVGSMGVTQAYHFTLAGMDAVMDCNSDFRRIWGLKSMFWKRFVSNFGKFQCTFFYLIKNMTAWLSTLFNGMAQLSQLLEDFICKESRRMQVKNMHHVQCHNRSLIEVHLFLYILQRKGVVLYWCLFWQFVGGSVIFDYLTTLFW